MFSLYGENIPVQSTSFQPGQDTICVFQGCKVGIKHCRRMNMLIQTISSSRFALELFLCKETTSEHGFVRGSCSRFGQIGAGSRPDFTFLGEGFCLKEGLIGPSIDMLTRLQILTQKMLSARSALVRQVHFLLGQIESIARVLPYGRVHKHLMQWHIKCIGLERTSLGIFTFPQVFGSVELSLNG